MLWRGRGDFREAIMKGARRRISAEPAVVTGILVAGINPVAAFRVGADAGTARDRDAGGMEGQPTEGRTDPSAGRQLAFIPSSREGHPPPESRPGTG